MLPLPHDFAALLQAQQLWETPYKVCPARRIYLRAAHWVAEIPERRPELRYRRGMYDFAGKSFCSRLRDLGCPDTLVKDVRDVAAAVMCSEGPGRSEEFESIGNPGHLMQSR